MTLRGLKDLQTVGMCLPASFPLSDRHKTGSCLSTCLPNIHCITTQTNISPSLKVLRHRLPTYTGFQRKMSSLLCLLLLLPVADIIYTVFMCLQYCLGKFPSQGQMANDMVSVDTSPFLAFMPFKKSHSILCIILPGFPSVVLSCLTY